MKTWAKVLLFTGIFLAHALTTVMVLSNMAGCGGDDCPNSLNYIWSRALGFPLFSIVEIVGKFSTSNHYSGVFLAATIPINSLVAATIICYIFFKFRNRVGRRTQ